MPDADTAVLISKIPSRPSNAAPSQPASLFPSSHTPEPVSRDQTPVPVFKSEAKPGVDVDWDDEDEATMIFDKSVEDTARSLLHSSAPPSSPLAAAAPIAAPGPPAFSAEASGMLSRTLTVPPPSLPRAPLPPPPKTVPASFQPPPQPVFELPTTVSPPRVGRGWLIGVVAVLLAAVGVGALVLLPKKGSLVLTVAGPGNKPVDTVEVYVDGTKRCEASPCRVPDLPAGTHLLRIAAAGYQPTADQAVKVSGGDEAVENIALTRASDGTGIRVTADGRGIKLSVDGKDIGPLPQELKELAPGDHLVRLDGGERYESFEKHVTVDADQMQTIDPKLKVKKGLATIKLGDNADGARVLLVSGSERRPLPQLPITVDISVDKPYSIVATKKGFADFEQKVAFDDGQAERTFVVSLGSAPVVVSPSEPAAPPPARTPTPVAPARGPSAVGPSVASQSAPKPAVGNGTLNINSVPVSNVLLDGRPLGSTPKLAVSVPPGPHTILFVNAELGRKSKSITVEAGKSATVAVRFP